MSTLNFEVVKQLFNENLGGILPEGRGVRSEWSTGEINSVSARWSYSDFDDQFELSIQTDDPDDSKNIFHLIFILNNTDSQSKLMLSSDVESEANYILEVESDMAFTELRKALKFYHQLSFQ